ncbi:MAG TPA: DUF4384 domain-containing protein, partial [Candidatus Ozemobacteraceae bacterium]|nr:DUF4384 domain-containing protein [Candidatus Ozemobacteraceae bacterium]
MSTLRTSVFCLLSLLAFSAIGSAADVHAPFAHLTGAGSGFVCTINAQTQGNQLNPGQALIFDGRADHAGYLNIVSLSQTGQLVRLFPNTFDPLGKLDGDKSFRIPGDDRYAFRMGNIEETDQIKVFFTRQPLNAFPVTLWKKAGHFQLAKNTAEALQLLKVNLDAAADQAVVISFTVRTRPGSASPDHISSLPASSGLQVSPTVSVSRIPESALQTESATPTASTSSSHASATTDAETEIEEDRIDPALFAVLSQPEPATPPIELPDVDLSVTATPSHLPLAQTFTLDLNKPCERAVWSMRGVPWKTDPKDLQELTGAEEEAANPEPDYASFSFDQSVYLRLV